MKAGLIGYPLKNGFSKAWFTKRFENLNMKDSSYENYPLERIEEFDLLCKNHPELNGLSVTIPHKQAIIPYLDSLSPEAEAIGAVNCIHFTNGQKLGHNTDAIGFKTSLLEWLGDYKPASAMVLGIGGAAKAIIHVLNQENIRVTKVGLHTNPSTPKKAYTDLTEIDYREHQLIVNCSPLGMHPNPDGLVPLNYELITENHWCYDLIYNPDQTRFLEESAKRGAKIKNGLQMLHLQAEAAFSIWNSK
ncbi:MAG: shikimate dehydrogenase [Bacteroidetes bacterium]|nr:shikimate dehydrogenase [Bacteroidota bacterium]